MSEEVHSQTTKEQKVQGVPEAPGWRNERPHLPELSEFLILFLKHGFKWMRSSSGKTARSK